jgi:hypothetical protein
VATGDAGLRTSGWYDSGGLIGSAAPVPPGSSAIRRARRKRVGNRARDSMSDQLSPLHRLAASAGGAPEGTIGFAHPTRSLSSHRIQSRRVKLPGTVQSNAAIGWVDYCTSTTGRRRDEHGFDTLQALPGT